MKKVFIICLSLVILVGSVLICLSQKDKVTVSAEEGYIRFHVRANSNSEEDQNVKYKVKNALVDYLTPLLVKAETIENAKSVIKSNQAMLESIATKTLNQNGFNYSAVVRINDEFFPTRSYYELTLESGIYDALIVELGSGKGDNWWCVVYPPLCFIKQENETTNTIIYKSKLVEIWKKIAKQ
ncbi:MAG: stage II sporulation protein R [Clostridia bacterium]